MNHQWIFWIALAAYALHIMEEFFYDWENWANHVLKLEVDWPGFYVTNSAVLFLGIACASAGWQIPCFSLMFPSLMLINAFFFHLLPTIVKRKFSPGLITALVLFIPIGLYNFQLASENGVNTKEIVGAFFGGILLMAYPIVLLKTKNHRLFNQKI